jgi:Flp pilus assembly pilin Flp
MLRISTSACLFSTCRLRQFLRNDRGMTAVEFAMLVPVLLLFVLGTLEFSLIMFTSAVMESATTNTARLGKTGYAPSGTSREDLIVESIGDRTAGLLDPTKIVITTKVYASFTNVGDPEPYTDSNGNGVYNLGEPYSDSNGNGQWDADMGSAGLGDAGDVVLYTISYPWRIMTPVMSTILGSTYNITVRTVVRNEPFNIVDVGG